MTFLIYTGYFLKGNHGLLFLSCAAQILLKLLILQHQLPNERSKECTLSYGSNIFGKDLEHPSVYRLPGSTLTSCTVECSHRFILALLEEQWIFRVCDDDY